MALTLSDEVRLIWRRPKSMSSVLFFANRYPLALYNCSLLVTTAIPGPIKSAVRPRFTMTLHQSLTNKPYGPQLFVLPLVLPWSDSYSCSSDIPDAISYSCLTKSSNLWHNSLLHVSTCQSILSALCCLKLTLSLQVIFVLRTYALYGCRRKVFISLGSLVLAVTISCLVSDYVFLQTFSR